MIKEIKKLKEKKYRNEKNQFIVEGFRFVQEALKSDFIVSAVFISDEALIKWNELGLESLVSSSTRCYTVSSKIFKDICDTKTPQGIAALVNIRRLKAEKTDGFYVLVDRVQDPGNMGTIIRSAHASGAAGIIITKGTVDIYNEKTLRSTMGSIFHVPVIEDSDFTNILYLKSKGFKLIVSSLDAEYNFYNVDLKGKIIISVGNEGGGVSDEVRKLSDIKVKIPMPGSAESLNAAVAASVMMFERVRQRSTYI